MKLTLKRLIVALLYLEACLSVQFTAADEPEFQGSAATLHAYQQFALRKPGNATQGQKLFEDQRTKCSVCHKIADKGGGVGVDLSHIGGKFDRPHLIESLLEPSRQIVEGYRTTDILTVDGNVINGIVKEQNEQLVTVVDASGTRRAVPRVDIEKLAQSPVSLMPAGLAEVLSFEEFADLIAYLESLRPGIEENRGAGMVGPISLPNDFELQSLVTGLDGATALEVLPDGRVLVCEQRGRVRVVENGKLLDEPLVTLPVDSYWERGVIGGMHNPNSMVLSIGIRTQRLTAPIFAPRTPCGPSIGKDVISSRTTSTVGFAP